MKNLAIELTLKTPGIADSSGEIEARPGDDLLWRQLQEVKVSPEKIKS